MAVSIISIEGNIGAGKSTLIRKLKEIYKNEEMYNRDLKFYIIIGVLVHLFTHMLCTNIIKKLELSYTVIILYVLIVIVTYYIILRLLKIKKANIVFLEEPIEEWTSIVDSDTGKNIFESYCANQSKYGFAFQMVCLQTRVKMLLNAISQSSPNTIIVCERSIFTDANVFAKMLYHTRKMNDIEYKVYFEWFTWVISTYTDISKTKSIYLYSNPLSAIGRKNKRNRRGEENIDENYMGILHNYHELCFRGDRVLMNINIDYFPISDSVRYDSFAKKILNKIKKTCV